MALHVNDGGTWREARDIQLRTGGQWKPLQAGWIREGSQWKQFWPADEVKLRKLWLGVSEDQPVLVLEARVGLTEPDLTKYVYQIEIAIKDQPLHTIEWRYGELKEWDPVEADGYQTVSMNSAFTTGDSALPPAVASALTTIPCLRQIRGDRLRLNYPKHWGGLPFDDLSLKVLDGGIARLNVSPDGGTTWIASNVVDIDTYLNFAEVTPAIARDDETTPAYVPRLKYTGTQIDYIPFAQLPYVRVGWELWTGGGVPSPSGGRAECLELPTAEPLPTSPTERVFGTYDTRYEWGFYSRPGFVLAAPPGTSDRSQTVGQSWWNGYTDGSTSRVHPLNILQSRVHSGLVYDPPNTADSSQNVWFRNQWECRGSWWRFCVVDETPGRPIVHRFSQALHWAMPSLAPVSPQVELTTDFRMSVISKGTMPALTGTNVLQPGRQTPMTAHPSLWLPDDAWTIYSGNYVGGSYGPLKDGGVLRFGPDMIPLCLAQLTPRYPTQAEQDYFDTFDPANTYFLSGEIVRLQSNWAVAVPGFETSGYPGSGVDKGVYLTRVPIAAWAEITSSYVPPAPPDPLRITQHPQIHLVGTSVEIVPGSTVTAEGGVPPLVWGDWFWEYSDDNQATWKVLTGTEAQGGHWLRISVVVTDAVGSTAKAESNTVQMPYSRLEWVQLPTLTATIGGDGSGNLSINQYSYIGGQAPYSDTRQFEARQGGDWVPTSTITEYYGTWMFRAVVNVRSNDGQTLYHATPAQELRFGDKPSSVVGTPPEIVQWPIIRVERDGPNPGDIVWIRCVEPAAVSVPPDATIYYIAKHELSNGTVMQTYDSRTDAITVGDIGNFTHGTAQLVYYYTITSSSYGTVQLKAASNVVDYDIRAYMVEASKGTGDCSWVRNPNSRAVCEAIARVVPFPPNLPP